MLNSILQYKYLVINVFIYNVNLILLLTNLHNLNTNGFLKKNYFFTELTNTKEIYVVMLFFSGAPIAHIFLLKINTLLMSSAANYIIIVLIYLVINTPIIYFYYKLFKRNKYSKKAFVGGKKKTFMYTYIVNMLLTINIIWVLTVSWLTMY